MARRPLSFRDALLRRPYADSAPACALMSQLIEIETFSPPFRELPEAAARLIGGSRPSPP
jgi:hypothetical protein